MTDRVSESDRLLVLGLAKAARDETRRALDGDDVTDAARAAMEEGVAAIEASIRDLEDDDVTAETIVTRANEIIMAGMRLRAVLGL